MIFLKAVGSYEELGDAWVRYRTYLFSIEQRLPAEAFQFATAMWHYNPRHHQALHDSWLRQVVIRESEIDKAAGNGPVIEIELLGAYHDGITKLTYRGVLAYEATLPAETKRLGGEPSHGDLELDELRLSESGNVLHEIHFSSSAQYVIECRSFHHSTTIPPITEP